MNDKILIDSRETMNVIFANHHVSHQMPISLALNPEKMNWTIIIIEALVMTAAFTAMILIPLVKNPVWWIHDYPEDIQEE